MAQISVNGKWIEANDGALLIDVLLKNNVDVPHFCYHPALGKDGNCRMCMVEIEGKKRPQIACDTPVVDGQVIRTKGENIDKVKRSILELELINHPVDCPICDQAGECKLQDYYMDVGLYDSRLDTEKTHGKKHVDLGSEVMLDQERCVLCTRCVRFTKDITKTGELGVLQRADHSVITTFPGRKLDNPYAMNVVDLCPVGALTSKDFRFNKRVWFLEKFDAICNGCAKGCNIQVDHHKDKYKDDIIYRYRPRVNEAVNGHFICDHGRLLYKKENENRLHVNLIQNREESFAKTLTVAKAFLQDNGADTTIVLSPSLSVEAMVMLKHVAKKYNAKLVVGAYGYYDETFGDDFLKSNDLAMNRQGALTLGLEVKDADPKTVISAAKAVLFIALEEQDSWIGAASMLNIPCALISAFNSTCLNTCQWVLPLASHMEREGSYVNIDGFLQHSDGGVVRDKQAPSLIEICAQLLDEGVYDCESVWKEKLVDEKTFNGIRLETLMGQSIKVDV